MFGEIEDNEDITREEWAQSGTQLTRVSNSAPQSRQEISEAQLMEIELRPVLLVSEHSRDKPALPWPQFQTAGQPFAPQSCRRLSGNAYPLGKAAPFGRSDAPISKQFE